MVHPSPESLLDTGSDYGTDPTGEFCSSTTDENVHRRLSVSVSSDKTVDGQKSVDHSPKSVSRAISKSSSRWRHDDISKEQILSIFQSELAKLKDQVRFYRRYSFGVTSSVWVFFFMSLTWKRRCDRDRREPIRASPRLVRSLRPARRTVRPGAPLSASRPATVLLKFVYSTNFFSPYRRFIQ